MLDPLMAAIRSGDTAAVDKLLDQDPSLLAQRDANGLSPLSLAAYAERAEMLARLRERHPQPDFWEACIVGDLGRVQQVLAAGQDVNAVAPDGFTPLGLAVFFRQPALARLLLDAGADPNARASNATRVGAVHAAVARADLATLVLLLERGADPNAAQAQQVKPLHEAAASGQTAIAATLLLYGAEAGARTEGGQTASDLARAKGFVSLAERLQAGAAG
jgi:uncharacterized protein